MSFSLVANSANSGVTAGAALVNKPAYLHILNLTAASGADATAAVYDNISLTGNPIIHLAAKAGTSQPVDLRGLHMVKGIYVVVAGVGATLNVIYE